MKKIKLYLETSVWNFLFADDAPEKMKDTLLFFDRVAGNEDYELYISDLVIQEINDASQNIQEKLISKIRELDPEELARSIEVSELADKYADAKLIPVKAYRDLIHVAFATVNNMDFLISWNLAHIVKAKTIMGVNKINLSEGHREINIGTVLEVLS